MLKLRVKTLHSLKIKGGLIVETWQIIILLVDIIVLGIDVYVLIEMFKDRF